jgi:hypothetical protein
MIIIIYKIKPSIYQTQLTDFIGLKSIEIYDMSIPKDYRLVRKKFRWLPIHPTWGKRAPPTTISIPKSQKRIQNFMNWEPKLKEKYLYRFPRVKIPRFEEFGVRVISQMEWDMHRYLKGFNGFFENLFEFNDFSFFQDLQETLENRGVSFKNMFIEDVFAYEMLRVNLGFKNYSGIERMGKFLAYPPLFSITHDPNFFPNAQEISYVLTRIPAEALFEFFQLLVKECVDCGIIVPRILIWDGQFIRSNCNNSKEKDSSKYNDPEAGFCQHNGVKKGVGYDPGILYAHCFNRWFPIYFKMFAGNRNDIFAFRETTEEFFTRTNYEWDVLIADSGPYSLQNMENIRFKGLVPIIRARKHLKTHPIRELKKGFFFNTNYIPKGWSDEYFFKIYSFRPMIEQGNSFNTTFYNASRMNTRGMEAAIKIRSTIYILVLLKALTAYKLGRPDLIMKPSAFESSRHANFRQMLPYEAQKSGYIYFNSEDVLRRRIKNFYGLPS